MKTYHITETRPAYQIWYYSVEAESEEQALKMVENRSVDPQDSESIDEPEADSEYTVIAETTKVVVEE